MTDTQHSPAPWVRCEDMPYLIVKKNSDVGDIGIAYVYDKDVGDETALANARLMAAAPEMYEAAVEVLELDCWNATCCPFHRIQDCESCAMRKLQHAVNKAKGETK